MQPEPFRLYPAPKVRVSRVPKHHLSVLAIVLIVATAVASVSSFFAQPESADAWMTNTGANWRSTDAYEYGYWEWADAGALPGSLSYSQLAIIGDYAYLFGGAISNSPTRVIYRAPLSNPTSWTNTGAMIPGVLVASQLAIIGDYVYLFGGAGSGLFATNVIYRAPLSNPTSWTNTGSTLPGNLPYSQLAIIGDYVYLFGGNYTNVIYRAPVSNPTSWANTGSTLPGSLGASQLAVVGDYVYLFGGHNSSGTVTNVIYRAPVSNPTSWTNTGSTLPGNLRVSHVAVIGDYVYLFGGSANVIYRAQLTATLPDPPGQPGTPTFTDVSTSTMTVNWTAATDADSYTVERCSGASCSSFAEIADDVTDLWYDDSALTPNTSYSYRIRGYNIALNEYGSYSGTGTQVTDALASCTFNGDTIDHGDDVTAYESETVPYGQSCVSEERSCSDGTLSGSYEYANCTPDDEPPPPPPDGAAALEGWAWSETTGWLSLSGSSYGLYINDDGVIEGYAWSENIGWVSAEEDDLDDCPQSPCEAYMNSEKLSGWLKALAADDEEAGNWDGFIALNDMNTGDAADYGVTLTDGDFSGFAWGDMNVGWLDFGYAYTEFEPCEAVYQCLDETHRDNLCTPTIVENESCSPGLICAPDNGLCTLPGNATGELILNPSLVPTGDTTLVTWDVDDTFSCRVFGDNGDEWFGGATGNETSSSIIQTTLYTLECANEFNEATTTIDTAYATVVPTWVER